MSAGVLTKDGLKAPSARVETHLMRQRWSRATRTSDEGFTLLELTVASIILITLLTTLLPLHVGAMRTLAVAKQRQQASQLANEVQEQLRALPYDVVVAGLSSTDTSTDTDIVSGRFRPSYDGSIDEKLQVSGSTTQAPLNPHKRTRGPINNVTYTLATYVTQVNGATPLQYWLTVVTTWSSPATRGKTQRYVSRSRLFSPYGCLSTATHPFSGPCQPFVYGTAGTTAASIAVRPGAPGQQILPGLDAISADLVLPQVDADYQVEQIVRSSSKAQTSGALIVRTGGVKVAGGGAVGRGATDTDPGTTTTGDSVSTVMQSGGSSIAASGSGTLLVAPTTGDTGSSASSVTATGSGDCRDLADVALATQQPCSSSKIQGKTAGGTVSLDLQLPGRSFGTFALGQAAPAPAASRAFATRFTSAGSTYCTGAAGADCSVAVVQRTLGTVESGALPAVTQTGDSRPAGWLDYLFQVSGYRDKAVAMSARTGTQDSASSAAVESGSLRYWNDLGAYSVVDLTAANPVLPRPAGSVVGTYAGGYTVQATLSLTLGGKSKTSSAASTPACSTPCVLKATVDSPVTAVVTYTIAQGATVLNTFSVTSSLGSALATATYKAASSA